MGLAVFHTCQGSGGSLPIPALVVFSLCRPRLLIHGKGSPQHRSPFPLLASLRSHRTEGAAVSVSSVAEAGPCAGVPSASGPSCQAAVSESEERTGKMGRGSTLGLMLFSSLVTGLLISRSCSVPGGDDSWLENILLGELQLHDPHLAS